MPQPESNRFVTEQSAGTNASNPAKPLGAVIALKAPLASPTFTGTVSGVTKTMVGLSSVDNTADSAKPVSTAQATALAGKVAKGELVVNVKDYGAIGDGATDDTAAFQAVANIGGIVYVPAGTYIIDAVSLTKSVNVTCQPGVTFKRKAGTSVASAGWNGSAMFSLTIAGLTVQFSDFTYDGNNANQTATEPGGMFLKVAPPAVVTSAPTIVHINRGKFINGTLGYLLLRGDDVQKRYLTLAYLNDCSFFETVYGKGKDDPATPSVLGYAPTYVMVMDYIRVRTQNFRAEWDAATGTGQYAACALNGTYYGSTYANSGESSIYMHGTTTIRGVGRAFKKYNDDAVFTNNAIGAIDMYGNADTLFIENVIATDCQYVPVRAKGSLKNYTVNQAVLTNCWRGLQVGPSSTGACETVVKVGSVNSYGGKMPLLEFVGNSSTDRLRSVSIGAAYLGGTATNTEALANQGMAHLKNITNLNVNDASIVSAPAVGVSVIDVKNSSFRGLNIDGAAAGVGLYVSGGDSFNINGFSINGTSLSGINLVTNPKKAAISNGRITSATDYGVFSNTTTTELLVSGVEVDTVGGLNRAFYAGGGNVTFIGNKSNASIHVLVASGTRKREQGNSWNAAHGPGTAAPTVGTWSVGDIIWGTAPAASGTVGWVCTTAGTPGTWKTFGTIAA